MTVYVCDNPYSIPADTRGPHRPGTWFLLWSDTSDEAQAIVWAVGAMPDERRRWDLNAWEAYTLTPEEFADVVMSAELGVVMTDKFGPAIWCARRGGDARRLAILEAGRARLR